LDFSAMKSTVEMRFVVSNTTKRFVPHLTDNTWFNSYDGRMNNEQQNWVMQSLLSLLIAPRAVQMVRASSGPFGDRTILRFASVSMGTGGAISAPPDFSISLFALIFGMLENNFRKGGANFRPAIPYRRGLTGGGRGLP
jgi:hypothetical protein